MPPNPRRPNAAVVPIAAPTRASPVAGPLVPTLPPLARLTAEQVIALVVRLDAAADSNAYALGLCLKELAQPERYRDELGHSTFEALLKARKLPSRVTAFKLIRVVSAFTPEEMKQLGSTEKAYALIRYAKLQNSDPRRYLAPNARVLGRALASVSANQLNQSAAGTPVPTPAQSAAAKKASRRLGTALRKAGIAHRMRVHEHGELCVSAHLGAHGANQLASALQRLRQLEKKQNK